jgi:hypothetical protein
MQTNAVLVDSCSQSAPAHHQVLNHMALAGRSSVFHFPPRLGRARMLSGIPATLSGR